MHKKGHHLRHAHLRLRHVAILGARQSCTNRLFAKHELQIHMQDPVIIYVGQNGRSFDTPRT